MRRWASATVAVALLLVTACGGGDGGAMPPGCDDDPPLFAMAQGAPDCEPPPDPEPPPPECEGCASVWGDPHLITFDQAHYALQAVGELTAVLVDDLEIQVRFAPWRDSRTVSLLTGVAARLGDGTFMVARDDSAQGWSARVDGEPVDPGADAVPVGSGAVRLDPDGTVIVAWPDGTTAWIQAGREALTLDVSLGDDLDSDSTGVFGDADGDRDDVYVTRDGRDLGTGPSHEEVYDDFAESWRVTDETSLFWYADGTSTETFTDRTFPDRPLTLDDLDPADRAAAEEICRAAGVTDPDILAACILDVATTGDPSFAEQAAKVQGLQGLDPDDPDDPDDPADPTSPDGGWATFLDDAMSGSGPLVSDGEIVLVHGPRVDDGEGYTLVALDAATGDRLWRLDGIVPGCSATFLTDGRIAVVAAGDGELSGPDGEPTVVVVDRDGGDVSSSTPGDRLPTTYCAPLVAIDDVLVVPDGLGRLLAYDVSGAPTLRWENDQIERPQSIVGIVDGRLVLVSLGTPAEALLIDAADGRLLDRASLRGRTVDSLHLVTWEDRVAVTLQGDEEGGGRDGTVTGLVVSGDRIDVEWELVSAGDDSGIDADLDSPVTELSNEGPLVVGHINAGDDDLIAFDLRTGDVRWSFETPGWRNTDSAAPIRDGLVYDTIFGGAWLFEADGDQEAVREWSAEDLIGVRGGAQYVGPVVDDLVLTVGATDIGVVVVAVPVGP